MTLSLCLPGRVSPMPSLDKLALSTTPSPRRKEERKGRQLQIKEWLAIFSLATMVFSVVRTLRPHQFIMSQDVRYLDFDHRDAVVGGRAYHYGADTRLRFRPRRHEFFMEKTSSGPNQTAYFDFDESESNGDQLEPLWKCSSPQRDRKLIFLHHSRSAGSTVRSILRAYATYCKTAIAFVSHCIDLESEYISDDDEAWINGRGSWAVGQNCWLTFMANRTGTTLVESPPNTFAPIVSNSILRDNNISILSGQLPIGNDIHWVPKRNDVGSTKSLAQYVVFFRRPLDRFVSEFMFRLPEPDNLSVEDAIQLLNQTVVAARKDGLFRDKYSSYFITPQQKSMVENEKILWTPERRMNLTLINLSKHSVLFGIVERLPQSLEMLQYLLDIDNEIPSLSEYFTSRKHQDKIASQKSPNRTKAIVQSIQEDSPLSSMMKEYLKYENTIYAYALQRNERQHRLFAQRFVDIADR